MKAKTYNKAVYIVKTWYRNELGNLAASYETWHLKTRAKEDYDKKVKLYGENNVFVYKAKQCMFE